MRQTQRDRVQAGQGRPDRVVEAARLTGSHHHGLAGPHQLADRACGQVRGAAAQARRQAVHADQAQPVSLDEHEPAGICPGQLPQRGRDPVEHGRQVQLCVHVRDHVAQAPHDPGPLSHVVLDRLVARGLVADADPAGRLPRAVDQGAGVDAQVEQGPVLADPAGGERDLAAGGHVLEHRVVLGLQLIRDERELQADDFGRGPAEQALSGRVPQHDGSVRCERDDGVGGTVDDRTRSSVNPLPITPGCHRQLQGHAS